MTKRVGLGLAMLLAVGGGVGAVHDPYAFRAAGTALTAHHPSQDLAVTISPAAVVLTGDAQHALSLALTAIDGAPVGEASMTHEGARVALTRPGVTEWYVHGPLGLEQGFTLTEAGASTRRLDIALGGDWATSRATDDRIELTQGDRTLSVDGLAAWDADARPLPVRMAIADGVLRLEVDAEGARYPVVIDPTWAEVQRLTSSDGSMGGRLGWSLAVSGDTAVIGAPFQATSVAGAAGAAYVFVRGATGWVEQAKLIAPDGVGGDRFGNAVAISGDTVVVGAPLDGDAGASSGSAYVFQRTGTTWAFAQKLTASDASASDEFGAAVSIDIDSIAIGAHANAVGVVYVFVRGATSWTQQAALTRNPFTLTANFGISVSISGSSVLVGADLADGPGGVDSGAAYVWTRSGSTWTEQAELNSLASGGEHFGFSVALDGNDAIVGAPNYAGGFSNVGRVQFYRRSGLTWGFATSSGFPSVHGGDRIGTSVAILGNVAVVGAPGADSITGLAGIFTRPSATGAWAHAASVRASDGVTIDNFGSAVATGPGPYVFVGRHGTRTPDIGGTAFVYGFVDTDGTSCTSGSTCASGLCVDGVCCNSACAGGTSDCQACSVAAGGTSDGSCTALSAARASTVTCRSATTACDRPETCVSGSTICPTDLFAPAATECRAVAGLCDVAEQCTGTSAACPPDAFAAAGATCRDAVGACDVAETCAGGTAACPSDAARPEGTTCGATPTAPCDAPDACVGTIGAGAHCDARFVAMGTTCRPASCSGGTETHAATCTGLAIDCPASTTASCAPFVCGASACLSSCASDGDCVGGEVCSGGACATPSVDAGTDAAIEIDAGVDGGTDAATAIDAAIAIDAHVEVDAAVIADAAVADAGRDAGAADAAPRVDASPDAGGPVVAGGCACRVPAGRGTRSGGLALGLVLLGLLAHRRRRRALQRKTA